MAQERIPQGGALAPYSREQAVLSQLRAAGVDFEGLLNQMRGGGRRVAEAVATPRGRMVAGLAAPIAYGAGSLAQGDLARGVGEIGGGALGAGLVGGLASALEKGGIKGKLAGGALRLAGGLFGGAIGGGVLGGTAQAAQDVVGAVTRGQMTRGESPGVIPGVGGKGMGGLTTNDIERIAMLNPKIAEQLVPTYNRMRDADMSRQMQLNQQVGQITGALNQQRYMATLADTAQSESGATTRSILTAANPYAASAFQYRG
jgi:hypothetical protein